jgi:hypothetical protein
MTAGVPPRLNLRSAARALDGGAFDADLLDLPWERSITEWPGHLFLDLPKGISRHEVRFLERRGTILAIKELPEAPARNDFLVLSELEDEAVPTVHPVAVLTGRTEDPTEERSAALVTRYELYSFSYRELLSGSGFGPRRVQLVGALAVLLLELHLTGCFWGDTSLSNVLYRFDAEAVVAIMVDAETAELHELLSDGQREHDLEIMVTNVAGGMADLAAQAGVDLDDADLSLGQDIADSYRRLWSVISDPEPIGVAERWRIRDRIERLETMGFQVDEIAVSGHDGGRTLLVRPSVRSRDFHRNRLRELTGVDMLELQARQVLTDLYYYRAFHCDEDQRVVDLRWRLDEFEPWIARLGGDVTSDPVQAYCDLLHHRWVLSTRAERSVTTDEAYRDWDERGRPGRPIAETDPAPEVEST